MIYCQLIIKHSGKANIDNQYQTEPAPGWSPRENDTERCLGCDKA